MNNDLVKLDSLISYAFHVKPNVDRIALGQGGHGKVRFNNVVMGL